MFSSVVLREVALFLYVHCCSVGRPFSCVGDVRAVWFPCRPVLPGSVDIVQPAMVLLVACICRLGYLELRTVPAPPGAFVETWVGCFGILPSLSSSLEVRLESALRVMALFADCPAVIGP